MRNITTALIIGAAVGGSVLAVDMIMGFIPGLPESPGIQMAIRVALVTLTAVLLVGFLT